MKKTLIAMAAVAVAGVASAQVSITGAVAFSLQNTVAAGDTVLDLSDADINFSASEDLGGGMKVSAATSISNEALRGNGTTANNTSIAISGGFGTLAYANVLSGQSKLSAGASLEDDMSDAMGGYTTVNVLDYTLPAFIPNASVTLEWAAAPQTPNMAFTGSSPGVIVNWSAGPMSAYVEFATSGTSAWDIRPTYDFGVAKVSGRSTSTGKREFAITMPMGAATVGYQYAKAADTGSGKAQAIAATYAMSKRTSVTYSYATGTFDAYAGKGTGDTARVGTNYRLQLKHAF
jgi:predicted porin